MSTELKSELTKGELWYIEYHGKCTEPSELGIKTAIILTKLFQGMHHVPVSQIKKINWKSEFNIPFSYFASMSTFDDNLLTRLIILAHEYCVRVEIKACNFHYFTIQFSKRTGREGPSHDRHPTVEQAGLQEIVKQVNTTGDPK